MLRRPRGIQLGRAVAELAVNRAASLGGQRLAQQPLLELERRRGRALGVEHELAETSESAGLEARRPAVPRGDSLQHLASAGAVAGDVEIVRQVEDPVSPGLAVGLA